MDFKKLISGVGVCLLSVCWSGDIQARQNVLSGGLSAGYEFVDKNYDSVPASRAEDRDEGTDIFSLEPRLTFTSTGMSDHFSLTYAPRFNFEEDDYIRYVDHDFGLRAGKNFTRLWSVSLDNNFYIGDDVVRESSLRTDDADGIEVPPVGVGDQSHLAERLDNRRFLRNTPSLSTEYEYRESSIVGIGYSYDILRNRDDYVDGYTESDRHDGSLLLSYRFSQQWHADFEGHYIRGIFDDAGGVDDLYEYDLSTLLSYSMTPQNRLTAGYNFNRTDYDHYLREDYRLHELSFGWSYDFTRQLNLTLSGGPSLLKRENHEDEKDYNLHASMSKEFFRSSLGLYAEKGYDQEAFDGQRSGLTDFWGIGADYSHQFTENLTGTLTAAYRQSKREEPLVAGGNSWYTEKDHNAGVGLSYSFLRWYTLSGEYNFTKLDTGASGVSNYDEHSFLITLATSRELFRW